MIEVAVIGAGSAGLVTAKHLLANGLRCCVFEAAATLGGAWSSGVMLPQVLPEGQGDLSSITPAASACASATPMWKGLKTNLSKHTCRFSDFPWPEDTPTFPSQEDMDWYLKAYAKEFLLNDDEATDSGADATNDTASLCSFLYDCRVTNISPMEPSGSGSGPVDRDGTTYKVEWTDSVAQTKHSKEFGGVVLTTGFFSTPKYPSGILEELQTRHHQNPDDPNRRIEILHSKDYASHEAFAGPDEKIAIVGSSHSALEIAVDLTQSAEHPVTVILPNIPWVLPRYVPHQTKGFLPIDLALYQRRHPAGKVDETTSLTPESCRTKHDELRALLGPRQDRILPVPHASRDRPPQVAISDLFLDLVADQRIRVVHGRLQGLTQDGNGLRISRTPSRKKTEEIDDEEIVSGITSLICCTGYSPNLESCFGGSGGSSSDNEEENGVDSSQSPSASNSILDTIDYDPTDAFSPMTTYLETLHPKLPNLAFVGLYRGPYMGAVELQARLAAQQLSGKSAVSGDDFQKGLVISDAIRHQDASLRPQFPRFDYVGFLDSLVGSLSHSSDDEEGGFPTNNLSVGDMVTPGFYQADPGLIEAAKIDLQHQIEKGKSGHHLPRVVMSALVGDWSFERDIVHFANGGKSIAQRQYIHGKVNYSRSKDHKHLRYREDGLFEISPTKSLPVFREYDYLVTETDSGERALELFFVEGGKTTYLFLSLKFKHQDKDGYWVATNDHLCVKDLYTGNFRIKLDGLAATELIITYRVQGPAKDYESTTIMRPIQG